MNYKKYLVIWVWLIVLLAAGTFVSRLPIPKSSIILLIMAISITKALLVALFFMHLKFERLVPLWIVAISPFFLVGLAAFLILSGILLS